MALSNWDTLALGDNGPSDGQLTTPLGVRIEIYKNWLYVHDETAWREGGHCINDTIMHVTVGSFTYLDLQVNAVRGPQEGVYVVASYGSPWFPDKPQAIMVGCGVYGWGERDGVQTVTIDEGVALQENGELWEPPPWIGVTPESVEFLRDHVAVCLDARDLKHPLLEDETWQHAQRYNQGDAYLTGMAGLDRPGTAVGQGEEPIITSLFRGTSDEADE